MSSSALRRALFTLFILAAMVAGRPATAQQQDWFRIGTGLGVEKPRVAVADFAPRSDTAKPHGALFTQVVRDDLTFSGIMRQALAPTSVRTPVILALTHSKLIPRLWLA